MKRTKIFGSAVAIALALIAIAGVSSAAANEFGVAITPAKLSGSPTGETHELWLGAETFKCGKTAFSGESKGSNYYPNLTFSPELNSCAHNESTVGWEMHGCQFRFHPGPGPALNGTMDIVNCEKPMSNKTGSCITEIGNQPGLGSSSGIGGIKYENAAKLETFNAIASIENLTYTRSGVGCKGALGTFSTGQYIDSWTVKAASLGGIATSTWVESTSAPVFKNFVAEEAPVTILGTKTTGSKVNYLSGNIGLNCSTYSLNGTSSSASTGAITVTPTFKNCVVEGVSVPDSNVSAGGCSYVLYPNGQFDIAGSTCATNPMTITRPGCTSTIGPQSSAGFRVVNVNEESGKLRAVGISGEGGNITYTNVGASCSKAGTLSNAKVKSAVTLTGANSKGEQQGFWLEK